MKKLKRLSPIRRPRRAQRKPRAVLPETFNESLHRAAYPSRHKTDQVLVFLDTSRALGKLDPVEWFKHLVACHTRTETAEANAERAVGYLGRLTKRLIEILTPEQIDHARVSGVTPEVYAIELLHLWKERDAAARRNVTSNIT